jgi:hypothetical protein
MSFQKAVSFKTSAAFAALALAGTLLAAAGCGSSSSSTSPTSPTAPTGGQSLTVAGYGDRLSLPLGNNPKGTIHFEAMGFRSDFKPTGTVPDPEYIYFYIWNGSNFYYKGAGAGFLYIPFEYGYTDYSCNYGKVKGRYNQPLVWPGPHGEEVCYVDQSNPWSSTKWYTFDITMDGTTITLKIDGAVRNSWAYGGVSEDLLAGFGNPPVINDGEQNNTGMIGMQFRNITFTKM